MVEAPRRAEPRHDPERKGADRGAEAASSRVGQQIRGHAGASREQEEVGWPRSESLRHRPRNRRKQPDEHAGADDAQFGRNEQVVVVRVALHVAASRFPCVLADPVAEGGFARHQLRCFVRDRNPGAGAEEEVPRVGIPVRGDGGGHRAGRDDPGDRRGQGAGAAALVRHPERAGARDEDAGQDRRPRSVEVQGAGQHGRRGPPDRSVRPRPPRGRERKRRRQHEQRRPGVDAGEHRPAVQERGAQSRRVGVVRDVQRQRHEAERGGAGGAGHDHPDESPDESRIAPAEGARHEQNRESRARQHRRLEGVERVGGRQPGNVDRILVSQGEEIDQPISGRERQIPGSPDGVVDGVRREHDRPEQAGRGEQRRRHRAAGAAPPQAAAGMTDQEGQEERLGEPVLMSRERMEVGDRRLRRRRRRQRVTDADRIGQEIAERPQRRDDEQPVPGPYRAEDRERRQGQLRRRPDLVRPEHRLERDQRRGQQQDDEGAACHGVGIAAPRITESGRVRDKS